MKRYQKNATKKQRINDNDDNEDEEDEEKQKKQKGVRLTPKKVQEFEKQLQENAQKPLGFFSFTNTEYAVFFVKKCDVSFLTIILSLTHKGINFKMKIEEGGIRLIWWLPSPCDELVSKIGIPLREEHHQVLDINGEFLIPSTKALETNASLASFVESDDYKVLKIP